LRLIKEKCTGCGYCVLVCPYDALRTNGWAEVIDQNCTNCNLCVYACPSDCFVPEPEFPLRPYHPRLAEAYDIVVIGSGLGGLMVAAAAAKTGQRVAVFEKLGFPGGRYTELNYRGAAVTTGAWTSLGPKSHIGRFLNELGIELDYVSLHDAGLSEQYTIRFPDGRRYAGLFDMLSRDSRQAWLKALIAGRSQFETKTEGRAQPDWQDEARLSLDQVSTADYFAEFSDDADLQAAINAVGATASGLNSQQLPASEFVQITLDGRKAGSDFAMPLGGVRSIINALVTSLRQAGGSLFVRTPVVNILLDQGRAVGVELGDGRRVKSRVVLHNGGPRAFVQLVGRRSLPADYLERLARLKSVECAALFCATREPLFGDAPMMMTPNCRRLVGIFSPTILDPKISKHGLYLFDAFFPTDSDDRTAELALAVADLRDLFPQFDGVLDWSVPMFFTGHWPGTESGQTFGQTGERRLDPRTPINNCYLVGMDVKGSGVAGDLIPLGVRRVLNYLEE
jgi:phytoene dehydrogenase-like protein/NAD-dependent dihydropyrimidine dehydrogenase PreA subunit